MGGTIRGDGERDGGRKRKGIGIHPREVPSDFSAEVAAMGLQNHNSSRK